MLPRLLHFFGGAPGFFARNFVSLLRDLEATFGQAGDFLGDFRFLAGGEGGDFGGLNIRRFYLGSGGL